MIVAYKHHSSADSDDAENLNTGKRWAKWAEVRVVGELNTAHELIVAKSLERRK